MTRPGLEMVKQGSLSKCHILQSKWSDLELVVGHINVRVEFIKKRFDKPEIRDWISQSGDAILH